LSDAWFEAEKVDKLTWSGGANEPPLLGCEAPDGQPAK
jgi:hypothetical protein